MNMTNTTKSRKSSKKSFTDDERKAYREQKQAEQQEMLAAAVDALTSQEGWLRYLNSASKFHNYSFNNRILIALQRPDATQIAGAGTWFKQFGRKIIKGEKALYVLGPILVTKKDENGPVLDGNGKPVKVCVGFKSLPVFDVSQTEGEDMPSVTYEPVTGESHEEYIYRCEALWQSMGYTVNYDASLDPSKGGSVSLVDQTVTINGARALNGQVRTHIHELAHAIGGIDYAKYTRKQAEVIVESAAYIATAMVGLDTSGMSIPYIATWGAEANDPKKALKIMKEFSDVIDNLVGQIVEGIS